MHSAHAEAGPSSRRLMGRISLGIALLVAVSVLATVYQLRREGARVEQMRAEIRARGEPVTAAELEAYYARPKAAEDATDLWVAALAEVERTVQLPRSGKYRDVPLQGNTVIAGRDIPLPGAPWSELTLAQEYLRDVDASLQALHSAANFGGHTRYPGKIADFGSSLTRTQGIHDAARRLQLEAYVRAHEKDTAGTANSLNAALMLSQSLRDDPTIVTMLVRVATHGIPVGLLLKLLPYVDFTESELARLQHDLEGIEFKEQLERATCGGRAWTLSLFDQVYAQRPSLYAPRDVTHWLTHSIDEATYLAMANDWIDLVNKPWPEMLGNEDAMAAKWNVPRSPFHLFTTTLSHGGGIGIEAAGRSEALNRFAILTIAVERMRRATGSPPERLQDLVPSYIAAIPDDPFTGEAFCYETNAGRYVLYSVSTRDGTKIAIRSAQAIGVDPTILLNNVQAPPEVSPDSVWTLPPAIHPYLLFRWPPQANEPADGSSDSVCPQ